MLKRQEIIENLNNQLKHNRQLVGVSVGSGLTARNAVKNGADLILALSSGVYRNRGVSSLGAYLPFVNSNQLILDTFQQEIYPRIKDFPVVFGLMATDPMINLERYIDYLKNIGVAGINNYPTVGLIDGQFREYMEENNYGFEKEVSAIKFAHQADMFTLAFVFNSQQIQQMVDVGADVICLHLGLTTGGTLGAKKVESLQTTNNFIQQTFSSFDEKLLQDKLIFIYGGPITSLNDAQFIYDNNAYINGYIGGSVFERFPTEKALEVMIESFKVAPEEHYLSIISQKNRTPEDYASFVQNYIHDHYSEKISLQELADILHLSRSYLSNIFTQEMGKNFSDYLIDYRLSRASELMKRHSFSLKEIASLVGYDNYPYFSRVFKKRYDVSPRKYSEQT